VLAQDLESKHQQLEDVKALSKKLLELGENLALEIQWMAYLDEFDWHVRKRTPIIPLIFPGFFEATEEVTKRPINFSHWWPERMPEMKSHSLFVDLRHDTNFKLERDVAGEEEVTLDNVGENIKKLYDQVDKYLEDWRGQPPDPDIFKTDDVMPCYMCVDSQASKPHMFDRKECEQAMSDWQRQQLEKLEELDKTLNANLLNAKAHEVHEAHEATLVKICGIDPDHKLDVAELLSTSLIFDAVPCPQCIAHNDLPPHTFDRKKCLEWFSGANFQKSGTMRCPKCACADRTCDLRILDIVVPQVFFSYNWGKKQTLEDGSDEYSTQKSVTPLRSRIELGTNLLVWLDIGGGMGFGESHTDAMCDGISKATVVVIFLSDAYVNSHNCQREFLHAVRKSKYIVPVLIAPERPDIDDPSSDSRSKQHHLDSGWTGAYPVDPNKNWWHHILKVIPDGVQSDPDDASQTIDWSLLGRFLPIDMRHTASQEPDSAEELTLIKKIMSRFHRGNDIDHGTKIKYAEWKHDQNVMAQLLKGFGNDDIHSLNKNTIEMFEQIDSDKSGTIDVDEILRVPIFLSASFFFHTPARPSVCPFVLLFVTL